MGRTLCVWYEDWPLRRSDAPQDEPCFVVGGETGLTPSGPRSGFVVASNQLARAAGVRLGLARREAEGMCPGGVVLERDPGAEQARFEPVAAAISEIVPRVEVSEPGLAFVPLAGAVRYFGGEESLVRRLVDSARSVSRGGTFGVARGPFAAYWAARNAQDVYVVRDEAAFLATLGIDALGIRELVETFRWLGIRTLGDLAQLPRAAVASRFGGRGLDAHRLASGEDRSLAAESVPSDIFAEERFEEPLQVLEQAGFAARRLANVLMSSLEDIRPHLVEIEAESATGKTLTRVWRSSDPFTENALTDRVWWQLRAWIEAGGIPGGLVRLRIAPADLSGTGRQVELFENAAARVETERAIARTQAILGPDSVLESRPKGGRDPQARVSWHRWAEIPLPMSDDSPWPGSLPAPSPVLMPPSPQVLEVDWDEGIPARIRLRSRWETVVMWAGPWRRLGKWWAGEAHADRYQLVTSAGAFLCEVRDGQTFLVGIYD